MAAGAAIWVAPQLSSVALAQDAAGSPPPPTSTSRPSAPPLDPSANVGSGSAARATGSPTGGGGSATGGGGSATGGGGAGGGSGSGGIGGELALTGADVRKLAAAGGAAVLTGSGLVAAERLSKRARPQPTKAAEGSNDETAR
jgi:hypothetical protein